MAAPGTPAEQRHALVQSLIDEEPEPTTDGGPVMGRLQRICGAMVRGLPASGAGVSVMTDDGLPGLSVASDPEYQVVEELQFTLGEGPCVEAFTLRRPVLTPDVSAAARQWPGYAAALQERGVGAVFAFPMQVGAARVGVIDVFRVESGALSEESYARASTFADVAVSTVLDGTGGSGAPGAAAGLVDSPMYSVELYQAQGMASVQLGVNLAEAMSRLRAYAYANNRPLGDVARDVLARRLRLDRDGS